MFVVVMSTAWWAASLQPTDDRGIFNEAVDDLRWVIEGILDPLSVPCIQDAPQSPSPLPGSGKPVSTVATWQARGDGKRQSKPTRKLLESLN